MMLARLLRTLAAALLLLAPQAAWTVFDPVNDDTDIFLANPSYNATRPNILIILDNTANWNQPFAAEKTALVNAVNSLGDSFNVGLMMFTESGGGNGSPDGGYVKYAIRQMTTANKAILTGMVTGLDSTADKSNGGKGALAMYEAFLYFGGTTAYAGANKVKRDYPGNSSNTAALLGSHAFDSSSATTYISPITDGCQKNFIIFISNGPAQDNSSDLAVSEAALTTLNGNVTPATIPLSPSGSQGNWMDEWARYMATGDCNFNIAGTQNVITYTVDVGPSEVVDGGQGPGWSALLKSMAQVGKGKYFAVQNNAADTTAQLEAALKSIFNEVQAVNSVFASTTLPVSVNVRGTNLNQVYIGVFRPDSNKSPRWYGNLKTYKLGVNSATGSLFLADATGAAAENSSTGFISGNARSYWTAPSTFWQFRDSSVNGTGGSSDSVDGDLVEKGGAAQGIRASWPTSQATRNVYTCTSGTGYCASGAALSASAFSTANSDILAADMGAYTTYSVSSLTSAGTTATATLSSTPSPAYTNGSTVRIEGASPSSFNGDFTISNVTAVTGGISFTYTLPAALSATTAVVTTSAAHRLTGGESLEVTGAIPSEYNTVSDVPVTRLTDTTFSYALASAASTNATTVPTLRAKKAVASVSGSSSGTTATATITGHGYGTGTIQNFSITGACAAGFNVTNVTATILNENTVQFPVSAGAIPGTLCGSASAVQSAILVTTSNPHELQPGDLVTISGLTPTTYNVTNATVQSVPSTTTFTYVTASTPVSTASGTATISATRAFVLGNTGSSGVAGGINNGSTNGTRRDGTGSTPTNHNVSSTNWRLTVSGATVANFNVSAASFNTSGVKGFTYTMGGNEDVNTIATGSPLTATFTRNSFTQAAGTLGVNFSRSTSDSTSGIQAVIRYTSATSPAASSVAVQTAASGSITAGRTSDGNTTLRDSIINWVRGQDNNENENSDCTGSPYYPCSALTSVGTVARTTDVRASVHGDVLHSRPAVINYNRLANLITGTDEDSTLKRDSDIYVFYGSNGGMLHAVKGGVLQKMSGATLTDLSVTVGPDANVAPGTERWSFVAKEFFGKYKRLRSQTPTISNTNQKDYFFDGSIGIWQKDAKGNGDALNPLTCDPTDTTNCSAATKSGVIGDNLHATKGDKVWLFTAMRRGGRFMYALDVTVPTAPKLLWRKDNTSTGWSELGQTWSEPKVTRLSQSLGNANNPDNVVLVFGAGYDDAVEDINPCLLNRSGATSVEQKAIGSGTITYTAAGSCTISNATGSATTVNRTMGRGVMIVDAQNGDVIWQAGGGLTTSNTAGARKLNVPDMTCAIPSDVQVLDKNRDGYADRVYVGDTCGQVWRLDLTSASLNDWVVTKIADLSSSTKTDVSNQRKFLFPPDLVFGADTVGNYTAVLLGSGDREHPFDAIVTNRMYMIKDRDSADPGNPQAGAPNSTSKRISGYSTAPAGDVIGDADVFDATAAALVDNSDTLGQKGWKITMAAGEKIVSNATTVAGSTFFNTNQPSATAGGGSCGSNLGIAREYIVGYADAAATIDLNATGGITVADRSTIHAGGGYLPSPVPVVVEIDGKKYQAVISGTSVQTPPGLTLEKRTRVYWYKEVE